MFKINLDHSCKDWILRLNKPQMKAVVWSIGMLKSDGFLNPQEAIVQNVFFSQVAYSGHPYVRVEVCGSDDSTGPVAYAYMRDRDEIYIVLFGSLSEVGLAAMLKEGIAMYRHLKGVQS